MGKILCKYYQTSKICLKELGTSDRPWDDTENLCTPDYQAIELEKAMREGKVANHEEVPDATIKEIVSKLEAEVPNIIQTFSFGDRIDVYKKAVEPLPRPIILEKDKRPGIV